VGAVFESRADGPQGARADGPLALAERRQQRVSQRCYLPPPELPGSGEPGAVVWEGCGARDGLERRAAAQHAGVEAELLGDAVAGGLETLDARLDARVTWRPGGALHVRQVRLVEVECAAHGIQQGGAVARAQRGGYLVHPLQLRVRPWQGAGHREQRVVSDDAERRPVLLRRHRLAPAIQLPQRRQLARWQHLRTLDAEKRVRAAPVRGPGPAQVLETGELLFGPREPLQSREAGAQRLAQRRQVLRVGGGVREHRGGQRPARPVGLLVLLGEPHAHVLFEQRGEPDRWLARELGGDTGVEQPARPEAVVAVQDPQVVVGIVEDLLDLRVIEQPAHGREVGDRERVDDRRQRRARSLDQIDAVARARHRRERRRRRGLGPAGRADRTRARTRDPSTRRAGRLAARRHARRAALDSRRRGPSASGGGTVSRGIGAPYPNGRAPGRHRPPPGHRRDCRRGDPGGHIRRQGLRPPHATGHWRRATRRFLAYVCSPMTPFPTVELTVYPYECDAFGHLNQAALLTLLERARWDALARGPGMDLFERNGVWPAVRKAVVEYKAAVLSRDVLRIETVVTNRGTTSITLRHAVRRVADDV